MRRVGVLAVLVGLACGAMWLVSGGDEPDPRSTARTARVDGPAPRRRVNPVPAVPDVPVATPGPTDDPHDPQTEAWIDLDRRVQRFLGAPLEPDVPLDADPAMEDAAFQQALDARLEALDALEDELIEVARDRSRPRRALEATVTLGELYADMGANVEQLPVPSHLGPRQATRWATENDARASSHLAKARLVFDMADASGAVADPGLGPRVQAGRAASSR